MIARNNLFLCNTLWLFKEEKANPNCMLKPQERYPMANAKIALGENFLRHILIQNVCQGIWVIFN